MKVFSTLVALLFGLLSAPQARAIMPVFDINVFYLTDAMTHSTESAFARTFYDIMVGFPVTRKKSFIVGWNYSIMSYSDDTGSGATTLSISDMGPKFAWYFDKERTWVIAGTYNLITKGTYGPAGGTSTELRGTSLRVEAGYTPQMWTNVFIGAKLIYYKATFNEEITANTALEQVSYGRTSIYPALSMTIRWE